MIQLIKTELDGNLCEAIGLQQVSQSCRTDESAHDRRPDERSTLLQRTFDIYLDIDLKLDGEVLSLVKAFIKLECSKDRNDSGKVHRRVQRRIVTDLRKRDEKI